MTKHAAVCVTALLCASYAHAQSSVTLLRLINSAR
jgi:hypothetical protein